MCMCAVVLIQMCDWKEAHEKHATDIRGVWVHVSVCAHCVCTGALLCA